MYLKMSCDGILQAMANDVFRGFQRFPVPVGVVDLLLARARMYSQNRVKVDVEHL
jgi:hypothetical protein